MLGVFALFCGLILLAGWVVLIRDWWRSVSWVQTEATIRGHTVEPVTEIHPIKFWERRSGFRPTLRYAYKRDEQTYVGTRFSATREPFFLDEQAAGAWLARFPIQGRLKVRVDPQQPRSSLVERQLSLADALPGYLALGSILIGVLTV